MTKLLLILMVMGAITSLTAAVLSGARRHVHSVIMFLIAAALFIITILLLLPGLQ